MTAMVTSIALDDNVGDVKSYHISLFYIAFVHIMEWFLLVGSLCVKASSITSQCLFNDSHTNLMVNSNIYMPFTIYFSAQAQLKTRTDN